MADVIATHGLARRFGRVHAFREVDVRVSAGEAVGLIGANGAGKSTLLRVLVNLLPPTDGRASVLDVDSRTLDAGAFTRIGYLAAGQVLPHVRSLGDLIAWCRPFHPTWDAGLTSRLLDVLALDPGQPLPGREARPEDGDAAIGLALDGSRLRADTIEREGVTQVLLSAPMVTALRPDERAQVWAHDATFRTPDGKTIVARTTRSVRAVDFTQTGLDRWPALAVLDPDDAEALRGVPLHYTGSFTVEVLQPEPLARATLAPGSRLIGGPYQLRVDALRGAQPTGDPTIADVTVLRTTPWFPGPWRRYEWHMVERSSGERVRLTLAGAIAPPSLEALLPTLAQPFMWSTAQLRRAEGAAIMSTVASDAELQLTAVGPQRLLRRVVTIDGLLIP